MQFSAPLSGAVGPKVSPAILRRKVASAGFSKQARRSASDEGWHQFFCSFTLPTLPRNPHAAFAEPVLQRAHLLQARSLAQDRDPKFFVGRGLVQNATLRLPYRTAAPVRSGGIPAACGC